MISMLSVCRAAQADLRHWFVGHHWMESCSGVTTNNTIICRSANDLHTIAYMKRQGQNWTRFYWDRQKSGHCRTLEEQVPIVTTGYGNRYHTLLEIEICTEVSTEYWWVSWKHVNLMSPQTIEVK